jgi:hypothetical protein
MSTTASPLRPVVDLDGVLALVARGWRVFPCRPCDKTPLVRDWQHIATTDEQEIRMLHQKHSGCNWGIVTGGASGIWVLDVDGPKGEASLKDLIEQYGHISHGFTVRTGKGLHLYFAWPVTGALRNSAGRIGDGLDVRGEGGYVLAPGSIHPSGAVYVVAENGPVPDAPNWIIQMAMVPAEAEAKGKEAIAGCITPGGRHRRLAHVIGRMLRDGMAVAAIEAAALAENATFLPPKPEADVKNLVADMAKRYPPVESVRSGFELVPLKTLLARGDAPVDYIWDSHLVAGTVSAVVAKPKVGKSTFARNLCLAIARGEEFLGSPTRKGECIYLALEERENEIRADFMSLGAAGTEPILIHAAPSPAEGMLALLELVRANKPRLVVIDPLFRLARIRDDKAYAEIYGALGPLIDVARETGTHVMLLHHSGKGQKADAIDAPLGSTAISGAVCTLVVLKRGENYRTIQTVQRVPTDLPETVLAFSAETKRLSLGTGKAEADICAIEDGIMDYLQNAGDMRTESEIAEHVEGKTGPKRKALRSLVEQGQVIRAGTGKKGDPFTYKFSFPCSQPIVGTRERECKQSTEPQVNTGPILVPAIADKPIPVPGREIGELRRRCCNGRHRTAKPLRFDDPGINVCQGVPTLPS